MSFLSKDVGVDLGTANTLVYMKGKGIIMREPSVVAVDTKTDEVRCVGAEAKAVIGRTPGSIVAVRPLKDGVIADFDITANMLENFLKKACGNSMFSRPRVVICIPSGVTEVERRAVREATLKAGARQVSVIEAFRVKTDEETGQTLISGMGELHLEIIIDRLMREFKVEADIGKPQIAYRETITAPAHGDGKLVKQSGGRGQYGHVVIDVKPNERGKGLTIENKIVGGAIPKEYMNAVYAGLNEAMTTGVVAGYPVVDVHVEVVDGSYHEVDSNENAFKMAAIFAMKDAFKKAKPIMLEPIMSVEASTPTDYQGDIMGDLNRRRGQISNMENKANACILKAMVPLSEMFGYSTAIRTLSSGRASYSMEPSHFEQVPQNLVDQIVSEKAK